MSPAELAERIGHHGSAVVEGAVALNDGKTKIDIKTGRLTFHGTLGFELLVLQVGDCYRTPSGQPTTSYTTDRTAWRTPGELRLMAMHLRQVAGEWERAAAIADEVIAAKPTPTPPRPKPRRLRKAALARFAHLEMDPPEQVEAGIGR